MVPVSNADGYVFTWEHDRMWRKTRTMNDPAGECWGTDPNRNWYTEEWTNEEGSSSNPCSNTYRGPAPYSEPMINNLHQYLNLVQSRKSIKVLLDIHNYSQKWLYPYGYTKTPPSNVGNMDYLGEIVTTAIRDVYGTEFIYGSGSEALYYTTGTTKDYGYDTQKVGCSITVELRDTGRYGFLLPEEQILPVADEMAAAYKVAARFAMAGYCNHF